MSLPFEIKNVDPVLNKELLAAFSGERSGYFHVGPKNVLMRSKFKDQAVGYYNAKLRSDDVWVITFPRSGTTWAQEMVWLINNNLDYDTAFKEKLIERVPFFEISLMMDDDYIQEIIERNNYDPECIEELKKECEPGYEVIARLKSPRHLKSHFPFSLLPQKLIDTCKVVYIARNPKDVAVSFYYHNRLFQSMGFDSDFKTFWNLFKRDSVIYAPYWAHIEEAWKLRKHPNMLFLFYEDMKKDLPKALCKVAEFLKKSYSEDQIAKLADHLDIKNFKNNPSVFVAGKEFTGMKRDGEQGYIRQEKSASILNKAVREFALNFPEYKEDGSNGQCGTWRAEFSPEMNMDADAWIKENEEKIGIKFQL